MAAQDKNQDVLEKLLERLNTIESSLESVQKTLNEAGLTEGSHAASVIPKSKQGSVPATSGPIEGKVIEGTFNGQNMIGPEGKVYPVPANYASKSKLVEGDTLKLTIVEDGSFIYKQIGPVERKKLIGKLKLEGDQYMVEAGNQNYNVLYASVTYFKAKPGDELTMVVPKDGPAHWAAIEAVIS